MPRPRPIRSPSSSTATSPRTARPARATSRGGRVCRSASHARRRKRHPIASRSSPTTASRSTSSRGPRRGAVAAAPEVVALPPFEEYYLSYVDRTVPCAPEFLQGDRPGHERHGAPAPRRARRGRRGLDALARGRPARRRSDPRAVHAGCRDRRRGRGGARALPRASSPPNRRSTRAQTCRSRNS